jgi:CRISPR-associated endonuclease Csn1
MRRLGIDIGTNSIGWCLTEDDKRVVDIGVRIFSDGRDPKSGASLAVDRREARAMRRRRDRYLGRRSAFLEALIQYDLMPENQDEARLLVDKDPYDLRKRALDEALTPYEIGRALFHLNQRRGFKSNRKADRKSTDTEDGKIATGAKALDEAMREANARTLGEFLAGRPEKRVRMNGESQTYDFYPQRRHIEDEFNAIWDAQTTHHMTLLTDTARAALHRILFYQRPLKTPEVGFCTFAGRNGVPDDERRLPKAHPMFQQRRLYEEVNNLSIVVPGEANRLLTRDQRDTLILKLQDKKKVSFDSLAKAIKLPEGERFNKDSDNRKELIGDEVRAEMADKKRMGNRWLHLPLEDQLRIIDWVQNEEDPDTLLEWLKHEYGLDQETAEGVANARLPEGYGRFGETATRLLLDALKSDVLTYDKAAQKVGFHHSDDRTGKALDRLPYYGELLTHEIAPGKQEYGDPLERQFGKITNPTVHIGLRQLEKLINGIIAIHGRPDEIVVELARELNLSDEDKKKHEQRIRKDTQAAIARGAKLEEEGFRDNGANRALMKQWEELNPSNALDRRCPYCANVISIQMLFSGEADIDHIIPYSQSLDDSAANKVVAHRHCNRANGNKTPYEKWGGDLDRWDTISNQITRLHKSKQWRFGPDARERLDKDGGFIARQLTDTQYLSRVARKYLSSLYTPDEGTRVYVATGRMTALLRRVWGLNDILPSHNYEGSNIHSNAPKNRLDHRHHAIDGAVMAVTSRSMLQKIATAAGRAENLDLDRMFEGLEPPWKNFRDELRDRLMAVTVSHKADHGRKGKPSKHRDVTAGRLHNDTAYGLTGHLAADGKTPIVVHRIPLMSLKPADILDPARIPDETLRDALWEATRDLSGKAFEAALEHIRRNGIDKRDKNGNRLFKGLRHVRVREPLSVITVRDKTGKAYKAYKGDSNARFDVWRLPNGKWVSDIMPAFDAHQSTMSDRRPHPAAKKVLSLRQNDLIAIERDGPKAQIVRVVKFSTNGQMALAADNESGALKARDAEPSDIDPFKYVLSSAGGLQKLKARQIRIDPLGRVFDPGPRE